MSDAIDEACERSVELLRAARTAHGFIASTELPHYAGIWTRDAAMACLGSSISGHPDLIEGVEVTLSTLAERSSPTGQIPNAVWPALGYWDWGEAGSADASAWFVVAAAHHLLATGRVEVVRSLESAVAGALRWLHCQDATGTGLVDSPAGADWMDSSLNRSGRVFHVNVLAFWAADLAMRAGLSFEARLLGPDRNAIDGLFWPEPGTDLARLLVSDLVESRATFPHPMASQLHADHASADRRHYLAQVSYGKVIDRCDVLAHCLAVCSGLLDGDRALGVLDHLTESECHLPYPSRTWPAPFMAGEPDSPLDAVADARQHPRWRNPPGSYHNGAVWPYVGAAQAAAEAQAGRPERAEELLAGVAAANRLGDPPWGFHEWIRVPDGAPSGARSQTWNAGAFVWAHAMLQGR